MFNRMRNDDEEDEDKDDGDDDVMVMVMVMIRDRRERVTLFFLDLVVYKIQSPPLTFWYGISMGIRYHCFYL